MTKEMAITILRGDVLGTNEQAHEAVFMAIRALKEQARVDAVEVVRCGDCSYCEKENSFGKVYYYCDAFAEHAEGDLIGVSLQVNPDHFCSWGGRRENDKRGVE